MSTSLSGVARLRKKSRVLEYDSATVVLSLSCHCPVTVLSLSCHCPVTVLVLACTAADQAE